MKYITIFYTTTSSISRFIVHHSSHFQLCHIIENQVIQKDYTLEETTIMIDNCKALPQERKDKCLQNVCNSFQLLPLNSIQMVNQNQTMFTGSTCGIQHGSSY